MDQPAATPAATPAASASAAPAPHPATPTPSNDIHDQVKPSVHPPEPSASSKSPEKSQNAGGRPASASAGPASTTKASTDAPKTEKAAETTATKAPAAEAKDRVVAAQEEAKRLQFALAQQQVQQYQAMTRQLEAQSGIAMTPAATGLARTTEDLQKLRAEQLARLQQNVQRQAAMAAQAVQQRSNDEWLRNKLLLEQEHLRLLRLHDQQLQIKGNTVSTATATSIADSLLAQQQQVVRQQQMLRDMLQKQQKQQQAQLQLKTQLQKIGETAKTTTVAVRTPVVTAAPTYYSVKKRARTAFDNELEALARVCIRVGNARTDSEMRQALDRMTTWLHRCTELMLLQIAQRDYRESLARRRPMLMHQGRWPLDLQVKSEYITQKIVQMLGAFLLREKNKAAQKEAAAKAVAAATTAAAAAAAATPKVTASPSAGSATGPASSTVPTSVSSSSAATTSTVSSTASAPAATPAKPAASSTSTVAGSTATAAIATPASSASPKLPGATAAATSTVSAVTVPSTTAPAQPVRTPVKPHMATIEREYAEIKAQLQAKQIETNQKAKAKRDAAKMEAYQAAGAVSNDATTAAMLAATYKRPLEVEIPGSAKKPRTDVYAQTSPSIAASYQPSTTTVPSISPRVAQQFYDLDLATRTNTESEDKMYLPPKIVSKIMYKALPGTHEEESGVTVKQEEKSKSPAAASVVGHQVDDSSEAISISDDAVSFMQECVTEFLLYFTSEARDLSIMQNKRTKKGLGLSISGSNVVEGMENLGFTPYARVLAGYNEKVKASQDAAARKKMERKRLTQQQAMQRAAAAAAASMAANAAKAAASRPSTSFGVRPTTPSPLGSSTAFSRTTTSPVSRAIPTPAPVRTATPTAKPVGVSTTTAKPTSVAAVPTPTAKPATASTPATSAAATK